VAPVRSVRAVGVGVSTRWRRDNRPDFPDVAVWVDAVAEIEIDTETFELEEPQHPDNESVPRTVDAWSPEYGKVWRPLSGSGREPRPGLLLSVVRAGAVVACPTPLPDPPTGALARALARSVGCSFKRIQCTPDLLPTDVTGASIFMKPSGGTLTNSGIFTWIS